ncbi:UNVERIFIED_CONTAM: hypothetical protein H355_015676 [Colinus virginianus]|nr:hypothetical protein H355_015676 [Colinus virginianus]
MQQVVASQQQQRQEADEAQQRSSREIQQETLSEQQWERPLRKESKRGSRSRRERHAAVLAGGSSREPSSRSSSAAARLQSDGEEEEEGEAISSALRGVDDAAESGVHTLEEGFQDGREVKFRDESDRDDAADEEEKEEEEEYEEEEGELETARGPRGDESAAEGDRHPADHHNPLWRTHRDEEEEKSWARAAEEDDGQEKRDSETARHFTKARSVEEEEEEGEMGDRETARERVENIPESGAAAGALFRSLQRQVRRVGQRGPFAGGARRRVLQQQQQPLFYQLPALSMWGGDSQEEDDDEEEALEGDEDEALPSAAPGSSSRLAGTSSAAASSSFPRSSNSNTSERETAAGGGRRSRMRAVLREAREGGRGCPAVVEVEEGCNADVICPLDCTYSPWSEWSACTVTCGVGTRRRSRAVLQQAFYGGRECNEETEDIMDCMAPRACIQDCVVSEWGDWSGWSATCGGAARMRKRQARPPSSYRCSYRCSSSTAMEERGASNVYRATTVAVRLLQQKGKNSSSGCSRTTTIVSFRRARGEARHPV